MFYEVNWLPLQRCAVVCNKQHKITARVHCHLMSREPCKDLDINLKISPN